MILLFLAACSSDFSPFPPERPEQTHTVESFQADGSVQSLGVRSYDRKSRLIYRYHLEFGDVYFNNSYSWEEDCQNEELFNEEVLLTRTCDANGDPLVERRGGEVTTYDRTYDPSGRSIRVVVTTDGALISEETLEWDDADRLVRLERIGPEGEPIERQELQYDPRFPEHAVLEVWRRRRLFYREVETVYEHDSLGRRTSSSSSFTSGSFLRQASSTWVGDTWTPRERVFLEPTFTPGEFEERREVWSCDDQDPWERCEVDGRRLRIETWREE